MKWLSAIGKNCIAKLWMVGIAIIVLIALMVSGIRGALPYLNQYQPQLSQYLFEQYNVHLTMKSVKGFWHDGGPLLIIDDINFNNQETLGLDVQVNQAKLHLDLLETVLALELRFKQVEVISPTIHIGDLSVFPMQLSDDNTLLAPWFNLADVASISNAKVSFSNYYDQLPDIDVAEVSWYNDQIKRQLQISLTDAQHQPLLVIIDLAGDTLHSLYGQTYVKANQWEWFSDLKSIIPQIKSSTEASTSFELWADFSAGQLDSMILDIGENYIKWQEDGQLNNLEITPELIQWLPNQEGWVFETRSLQLQLNDKNLTPIDLYIDQNDQKINIEMSSVILKELMPLSSLLSIVDTQMSNVLGNLNVRGSVERLKGIYENNQWHYQGHLTDFSIDNTDGIPSINQLNGAFSGVDNIGRIELSMNNQILDFGDYSKAPIEIVGFDSTIEWGGTSDQIFITSPATTIINKDQKSTLAWKLEFNNDAAPHFTLLGNAEVYDAKRTEYYLPHIILSDGLINYLSGAIQGGYAKNVGILWHGALDQFPYTNNNGSFEIHANITNASFEFNEEWAPLTQMDVNLHVKNDSMQITGMESQLDALIVENWTANINSFMLNPALSIAANINQPQSTINQFVFSSPINDILGPTLRQMDVSGDVNTLLDIQLPLDGVSLPVISGVVQLQNNDLLIKAIDVDVKNLHGDVVFNGANITANNVTGIFYQQPVILNMNSKPVEDIYHAEIDLAATWHIDKMPTKWQKNLNAYIDGSLDWQGKLTLNISDKDIKYNSTIKSSMEGLALQLPKPLDKYVEKEKQLYVTAEGNLDGGIINATMGANVEARANIDTQGEKLTIPALTLLIGRHFQAQDEFATNGMMINLDLEYLALDEWAEFINNVEKSQSDETLIPPLNRVNASVYQVHLYDYDLDIVDLTTYKKDDFWEIYFDSTQAKGVLTLFDDLTNKGMSVDFERLNIIAPEQVDGAKAPKKFASRTLLRNLPPLSFNCSSCQLLGTNLGEVSFSTKPHLQGIAINDVKVNAKDTKLDANFIWGFDEKGEYTTINGRLNSENIESTLALLDYSSSIRDSDVSSQFDLMWRDSLYNPSITSLSGQVHWELGEGHIAEISDQGARIFSLFSLDSLRRKLVLDFRDVFQEGIFFNDFEGDFNIDNGVAVTTNAYMDGVAGGVDVVGSVNLSTQELDYYISFSPRLFSNLPVIAGVVASQPQIFVLTFAITKVLEPIINVISQVNFKLSGTINEPDFIETDRQQKEYIVPPHILEKANPVVSTTPQ